jgi:hypothetical protein
MKKISQQENDYLLDYIDGSLTEDQKRHLEQQLSGREELRVRLEDLRQVHRQLAVSPRIEPSKNFTQLVMSRLDQYPLSKGFSTKNGILLLAGVMIAIGVGALLLSAGVFDGAGSIDISDVVIQNQYIDVNKSIPSIPINGKIIVNVIIALNLALAFMVLDRAIIRPWFEKRTKMHF